MKETSQQQAEYLNMLLRKQKKLFGSYIELGEFEEPIAILMRRGGTSEFLQNVKDKELRIMHSDGEERKIFLTEKRLISFPHGNKRIKGYILHEDFPTPLPEDPLLTTEETGIALDKTAYDLKKWKADELKQKGKLIWYLLGGVAVIILAYAMYVMLKPPEKEIIQVVETTTTLARIILG